MEINKQKTENETMAKSKERKEQNKPVTKKLYTTVKKRNANK